MGIKHIFIGIGYGLFDSVKGIILLIILNNEINHFNSDDKVNSLDERSFDNLVSKKKSPDRRESKILKQVLKCCTLNGLFTWVSIVLFENGMLPGLHYITTLLGGNPNSWETIQLFLRVIFNFSWVLPIFVLSKIVSGLWFQDIADEAYRFRKGRPTMFPNISKFVADTSFSLLVQILFLIQSFVVSFIPKHIGAVLCFIHMCLLYSLYSFEYKWVNMGWELDKRLSYVECNWPYFIGFGIPLTILTSMPESIIVSGCLFSILFPIFIISGNEAKPIVGSEFVPVRLFSPVVALTNLLFTQLTGHKRSS